MEEQTKTEKMSRGNRKKNPPIIIKTDYLGAVKQIPFLCRSLRQKCPDNEIYIVCSDHRSHTALDPVSNILKNDLERESIPLDKIHFEHYYGEGGLDIKFNINKDCFFYHESCGAISFSIDPLKFERRKLLDAIEIKKLREKYGGDSDNIILGGSLNIPEGVMLVKATREIVKQRPQTKVVLVPRKDAFEFVSAVRELSGHSNYIVVSELGILDTLYSLCDIAVVGNTWNKYNFGPGQNPLEPAFYGKPILCGGNSQESCNMHAYQGLKKTGLLRITKNAESLEEALQNPLSGEALESARTKTYNFIESMQGVADIYSEIIRIGLQNRKIPRALAESAVNFLPEKYASWKNQNKD